MHLGLRRCKCLGPLRHLLALLLLRRSPPLVCEDLCFLLLLLLLLQAAVPSLPLALQDLLTLV